MRFADNTAKLPLLLNKKAVIRRSQQTSVLFYPDCLMPGDSWIWAFGLAACV